MNEDFGFESNLIQQLNEKIKELTLNSEQLTNSNNNIIDDNIKIKLDGNEKISNDLKELKDMVYQMMIYQASNK